jgi:hypothetical protein
MKMRTILLSLAAGLLAAGASAQSMKFVDRGANVYCRFSPNCQISPVTRTDSWTTTNGAATCVLESRSFPGTTPNTQGQYGYEYQLTLNSNGAMESNVVTVSSLTLNFPDPQYFSYGLTSSNQVWIVGSDTGIVPSDASPSGKDVTFSFSPPIILSSSSQGTNTCSFGMVSSNAPAITTAILTGSTTGPANSVAEPFKAELQAQTP